MTQAAAEDRLAPRSNARGGADVVPLAPTPAGVPPPPARPAPTTRWLTAREAAATSGLTPATIRALARSGRLGPAYRVHMPGEKGPPRWIVATKAVLAYRLGNEGYAKRVATPTPAGLVTIKDFAAASGLPWATLHRRMDAKAIASVKRGWRRFIPESELARFLEAKQRSD